MIEINHPLVIPEILNNINFVTNYLDDVNDFELERSSRILQRELESYEWCLYSFVNFIQCPQGTKKDQKKQKRTLKIDLDYDYRYIQELCKDYLVKHQNTEKFNFPLGSTGEVFGDELYKNQLCELKGSFHKLNSLINDYLTHF